ncbi:MAG: hypothetical protein HYT76_09920 [Deltaproteobacteria bacterium]|nr:hypothetical protein [Deltaproteobacteria bacterium]
MEKIRLSALPISVKILITCFVMAIGVGYSISILQVRARTHLDRGETVRHFRGSEQNPEVYLPQSTGTMVAIAHVHSFSQPVVVGLLAFLFLFTPLSEGYKTSWILISFAGSLTNILSPWFIRDISPHAVYLLYLSGGAMLVSFLVMALSIIHETWKKA